MIDVGERLALLKRALGDCEVARDGVNIAFSCPACGSGKNKKKLAIKIDTGQWHCWVCEIKGRSVPSLLRKFATSLHREWCERFEKNAIRSNFIDDEKPKDEVVELPDALNIDELYESSDPDAQAIVNYLERRGIDADAAYRYRILGGISGRLRRRVVIPSFDSEGRINYWTARSIEPDAKYRYVNPKINRKSIIFNEVDIDWKKPLTLVEGPFDLFKAGENAVALLGSTLPQDSLLFRRIIENQTNVTLALDPDAIIKSHKIAKILYQYNISIKFIKIPVGIDVGDMSNEEFESLKKTATVWNPISGLIFKINNITTGSLL